MGKVQCSLCFLVVAVLASLAWIFSLLALFAPGNVMVGPMIPPDMGNEKGVKFTRESLPVFGDAGSDFGWTIAKYQSLSSCTSAGECAVK